jgi:hypothetical protein
MSIKFVCSCGKHLRARDEMAARRSMCPACGAPVGVPSFEPSQRGGIAGPIVSTRPRPGPPTPEGGLDLSAIQLIRPGPEIQAPKTLSIRGPRTQRRLPLEKHWWQCLSFALSAWRVIFVLALMLTLLVGLGARLLLAALIEGGVGLAEGFRQQPGGVVLSGMIMLLFPILVFGYAGAFLDCVISSAAAGERRYLYWPGWKLDPVLRSGSRWLLCFLAGPVVPAGAAVYFWLHSGDSLVDRLIIAELTIVASGYWLLAVLAVGVRNRLSHVDPAHVLALVGKLGLRTGIVLATAAVLVAAEGLLLFAALEKVQEGTVAGWLLLFSCWCRILFGATFLFRLVGIWCYYADKKRQQSRDRQAV